MFKNFLKESIKVVAILAIAIPAVAFLAGWQGPKGAPPTENALPPVNVGSDDQVKAHEVDGLGNLIPGKSGGLNVGRLISRFTTLLAKDGGNVGIGMDGEGKLPEAKLHVDGGDAIFEGGIQIKGGLPEKDKVLTSVDDTGLAAWKNVTADMLIPEGYEEVFFNTGEDIYGAWVSPRRRDIDSCDGNDGGINNLLPFEVGAYECGVTENKVCKDWAISVCLMNVNGSCRGGGGNIISRSVECHTAKILRKNEWKYETVAYTGNAVITAVDDEGDHEYGWADITINGLCSRTGVQSGNLNNYNNSKFRDWMFDEVKKGNICSLPFKRDQIVNFTAEWDIKALRNQNGTCLGDGDGDNGHCADGSGDLKVVFKIITSL